jgi:pSer/pThr/pTyr-binding forkhead associated (FHA) protein
LGSDAEERILAWLVCGKRPPVALGPKPTISIGRGKDCDLVLRDPSISRMQAVVKVDVAKGTLRFVEGGSSNGSQLNGETIDTALLTPGDVLTFGRFEVRVQAVLAWLCSGAMPPIPLGNKPEIIIGRSKECDLSIRDKGISRRQGVVHVHQTKIEFEDGGGSNGSFVNGKRVSGRVPLQIGDVLTFGPYEATLRSNEEMQSLSETLDLEGTVQMAAVNTGLISETALQVTLQELSFNRKTGTLGILAGRDTGLIVFRDGKPARAFFKELKDDDAVLEMLALDEGRFSFASGVGEEGETTMTKSITALLLEDSRRRDELTTRKVDPEEHPTERIKRPDVGP